MNFYIFTSLLLLIFFFLIIGLRYSLKAPYKIRIISIAVLIILFLRYISVAILFFSESIKYLYLCKPIYFSYLLCIPITFMISIYIFAKIEKISFNVVWAMSAILFLCYGLIIEFLTSTLQGIGNNGYTMKFIEGDYVYWIYLGLITAALIYSILIFSRKKTVKLGVAIIIMAALVTIIDFLLQSLGITLIGHQQLIGEAAFIGALCYGLFKIKK